VGTQDYESWVITIDDFHKASCPEIAYHHDNTVIYFFSKANNLDITYFTHEIQGTEY
jgi:hypothetical protein